MVIALLDSATVPHGAAFWARTMAEQLACRDHRVTLLVPPQSPLRDPPPRFGAALHLIPLRDNFDLASVAALHSFLRRKRVDVLLLQGSRGIRLGSLAALLAGVPAVARVGIGGGLKTTVYDRWIYRRAVSHFIANARSIEQELAAIPWVGPDRVTHIYNGIDFTAFGVRHSAFAVQKTSSQHPTLYTQHLTPNTDPQPVIAVVARLQAHKGHEDLLRCLPGLWQRFPGLCVLLAGQGPHEAHLRGVAQEIGANGQVQFLGHCPDVRPVLAAADLFVLPSHREGLPNAVLEAMAMGVPVVAAAADGTGEVVVDGQTGLLTPPGDITALGTAIIRVLDDAPLRARLVSGARQRLKEQFSLPRAVEQVEALLHHVVRNSQPAALHQRPDS